MKRRTHPHAWESIAAAARRTGVPTRTLWRWVSLGRLTRVRLAPHLPIWVVRARDVDAAVRHRPRRGRPRAPRRPRGRG